MNVLIPMTTVTKTPLARTLMDLSYALVILGTLEMELFAKKSMNVLFLLTTVTKTPLATTLMDLSSALVTPDTLEMELFAKI